MEKKLAAGAGNSGSVSVCQSFIWKKSEPVTLYYLVSDDDLTEDANINLLLNPMGAYGSKTTYKLKDENTTVESVKKYAFIKLNDLLRKSEEY